jgi:hypothetical protein
MMRRQRGVTMIGWICLLVPLAICLYAAIRVGPEYMNYYKVVQALKQTSTQLKIDETVTAQSIRSTLGRRFDTSYVDHPEVKDIIVVKGANGWTLTADYEATVPMFGNLHLLMAFKTTAGND